MVDMSDIIYDTYEDLYMDDTYEDMEDHKPVVCKYCRTPDLFWDYNAEGEWRLFTDDGRLHQCKKKKRLRITRSLKR